MASLKKRLTLILLAGLAGLLALGGSVLYPAVRRVMIDEFDQAQKAKLLALTSFPEPGREGINLIFIDHLHSEFQPGPEAEYYQVWLQDGSVLSRSPSLGTNDLPRKLGTKKNPAFFRVELPDGQTGRAVGVGFGLETEVQSETGLLPGQSYTVGMVLARDTARLNRVLDGLLIGMLMVWIFLVLLAGWVVHLLTRRALHPVQSLASELQGIDVGSLKRRFEIEMYPEELRPIVLQINLLMDRIASGLARERRFAANAAHELLTPVAELRTMAEAARQWSGDPEATGELAADTLETARQMEHIIRNLLSLTGTETNVAAVQIENIDIACLLEELRGCFQERIDERKLSVDWRIPGAVHVKTDGVLCKSILFNLLDNAVDYTPARGVISCAVREDAREVELIVGNDVRNLTESDVEHFFEPLWRKDDARSARAHAGLGLSVALTFARALDAELSVKLLDGERLEFRLRLRKADEKDADRGKHAET